MNRTPDLVVLFDIDGTLLHTQGAGVRGMKRAFARLHRRPDALEGVPVAGRTDRSIVTDGFHRIGVAPDDDRIRAFRDVYVGELPDELERVATTAIGVLPGVEETIRVFDQRPGVALGLVTGNFEVIAALKLDHYRLSRFFSFGGFGDHHLDRRDLLPMALARAEDTGIDARSARVVVIGDTPLDVDCARARCAGRRGRHGSLHVRSTARRWRGCRRRRARRGGGRPHCRLRVAGAVAAGESRVIGSTFGSYRVLDNWSGRYGRSYRARDVALGRDVAIKILPRRSVRIRSVVHDSSGKRPWTVWTHWPDAIARR